MDVIVDTETTGLTRLSFANKLNYKQWPRMVQVAWALIEDGAITERHCLLVRPNDHSIPASATQLHGITQQEATEKGQPVREVLQQLHKDFAGCESIIAHNILFDLGVIQSEAIRAEMDLTIPPKRVCTVHKGRQYLVKAKGLKQGGYPKLSYLYETLFGFSFSGPHDAANDLTACFHVYKKLKNLGF